MKRTCLTVAAGLVALRGTPADADTSREGRISRVDVTSAENFGFRVYFDREPMCDGGQPWAFMNRSWSNYEAAASVLTSAWMSGKTVTVISSRTTDNFCQIVYVAAY